MSGNKPLPNPKPTTTQINTASTPVHPTAINGSSAFTGTTLAGGYTLGAGLGSTYLGANALGCIGTTGAIGTAGAYGSAGLVSGYAAGTAYAADQCGTIPTYTVTDYQPQQVTVMQPVTTTQMQAVER